MKGKRFKEEQIIRILHEAERGLTVAKVCRQHNCSEQSFKTDGAPSKLMDVSLLNGLGWEASISLEASITGVYQSYPGID